MKYSCFFVKTNASVSSSFLEAVFYLKFTPDSNEEPCFTQYQSKFLLDGCGRFVERRKILPLAQEIEQCTLSKI